MSTRKQLLALLVAASACVFTIPVQAQDAATPSKPVAGEKIDSGLGDLPPYSQWADPTGRDPLRAQAGAATSVAKSPATDRQLAPSRTVAQPVQTALNR